MAAIPGYRVGGKTGTAQAFDETAAATAAYTASFIGFAPADDPAARRRRCRCMNPAPATTAACSAGRCSRR